LHTELGHARKGTKALLQNLFEDKRIVDLTIGAYLLTYGMRLVYPEFKLHLLLLPPSPDIVAEFTSRFTAPPDTISKLFDALSHLFFPFYLLAVMYYRHRFFLFVLLLGLPLYILYCAQSYIGRGEILTLVLVVAMIQWYLRPHVRKYIIILGLLCVPLIPAALIYYQDMRLGNVHAELEVSSQEAVNYLVFTETSFPVFSEQIISSGKQIDLKRYFIWMLTLPIPKAITGPMNPPSAGMEMSEILLGLRMGQKGFFALLAGLLTESVYIYGVKLYFIHAIIIAFVMACVVRITEGEQLLFLIFLMLMIDLTYRLNRAGLGPALATVVNLYFSLYILFLLGYLKRRWRVI
jgi:hypothetical protein